MNTTKNAGNEMKELLELGEIIKFYNKIGYGITQQTFDIMKKDIDNDEAMTLKWIIALKIQLSIILGNNRTAH